MVLADCHPFQRAAVETDARFITLLVGRGGGKTTTMRARNIRKLSTIRRGKCIYFAKTRDQARELMWEPLKASLEAYETRMGNVLDDNWSFSEFRLVATCKRTGATLRLLGMDDQAEIEKLRGQPFDEVQPDEGASHKPELLANLLDRIIGPRLGERRGCLVLGGSPGHILRGPFYDFTRPGASVVDADGNAQPLHVPYRELEQHPDWDGYVSYAWTLKDVVELPDADRYPALQNLWAESLLIQKRNRWSDTHPIWLREYMGIWAADDTGMVFRYRPHKDGAPWNQWDPFASEHPLAGIQGLVAAVAKLKELHADFKDWRYVVAGDSGSSDPWACNVFAFSPQDTERRLWHVMTHEQTGMYPKLFSQLVQGPEATETIAAGRVVDKYGGILGVTGWPDGMVLDGDQTTIDELANVYGLRFTKADRNPLAKMGGIEMVNGDLLEGRIKVIRGSVLEQQLQQLQFAEDVHGNVKENKAQSNHSTDTLIYARKLVGILFESGVVQQDAKPATTAYKDPMGLQSAPTDARDMDRGEFAGLLTSAEWSDISL